MKLMLIFAWIHKLLQVQGLTTVTCKITLEKIGIMKYLIELSRQKWSRFCPSNPIRARPFFSVKSGPTHTKVLSYPNNFCRAKTVLFTLTILSRKTVLFQNIKAISSSAIKTHNRKILSMHLWLKQDNVAGFILTIFTFGYRLCANFAPCVVLLTIINSHLPNKCAFLCLYRHTKYLSDNCQ